MLDLRTADGREVFQRLVRRADVVIENFRPGVMARFGLDYAALAADQPALIYASVSGYGQTGPWAGRGGFDLVLTATAVIAARAGSAPCLRTTNRRYSRRKYNWPARLEAAIGASERT